MLSTRCLSPTAGTRARGENETAGLARRGVADGKALISSSQKMY